MQSLRLFPRLLRDLPCGIGLVVVVFAFLLCAVLFLAGFPTKLNCSLFVLPVALAAWMFKRHGGLICLGAAAFVMVIGNSFTSQAILWPRSLDMLFLTGLLILLGEVLIVGYLRQALDLSDSARSKAQQVEQQLLLAYEQQQRVNLVKDQFLLNINHELRTPLTEIHGYLELLREYNGQLPSDTQAVFIENALRGCEELKHLINNVLDTVQVDSDLKPPAITDVCLATEVHAVLSCFDPRRWDEYTLHLDVPETLVIQADVQYLHCVLRNLLSNIFKYVPAHTVICISAFIRSGAEENQPGDTAGTHACISIKDEGPGIPPYEVPYLFDKFIRLQRDLSGNVRGSGLGLYISKQMVEVQGGSIWAESSGVPGKGALFCFTLPAVPQASSSPE